MLCQILHVNYPHHLGLYDPCIVAHTRTSLLRTLNSNINTEWLLPETRALFEQQWKRQLAAAGKLLLFLHNISQPCI